MKPLFDKLNQHFKIIDLDQFKKDSKEINKELEGSPDVFVQESPDLQDLTGKFKEHLENVDRDEFLSFWDGEEKLFGNKEVNNCVMTQEEILEYNKRCVEFLGFKKDTVNGKDVVRIPNKTRSEWSNRGQDYVEDDWYALYKPSFHSLEYHSDWNWIMEIIEAISNKFGEVPLFKEVYQKWLYEDKDAEDFLIFVLPKEAVVQAINRFLIWYNKNK